MPRVDIWDVAAAKKEPAVDCGLPRDLEAYFEWGRTLGKGGFGLVRVVVEKSSGIEFACKSVSKTLDIPNLSPAKQAQHLDNVKREIKILTRLRGTLSVVHFKGAYEDDQSIHLVMELCRGGELVHEIGRRPYDEKTVAGYMRSVLHTLAQCHSHRILHRDIKPGNFMLLIEEEDSPLKAIDFGLAVFYDPDKLPRTDLGLEGTPWFMAPETLSSQTYPASDIWAAGVMAYQLLSGYLPFDDPRNPNAPALSVIWKGILSEQPSFRRSAWKEVSDEAKDFVSTLLNKDHTQRPTAKDALRHPWLSPAFHEAKRRPLSATVVQRIQRFAQNNALRRTILELIAQELLKMMPALTPTVHGQSEYGSYLAAQQAAAAAPEEGGEGPTSPASEGHDIFPMSPDSSAQGAKLAAEKFGRSASPEVGRSASINLAELQRQRARTSIDSSGGQRARTSMDSGGGGSLHGSESFKAGLLSRVAARAGGSAHGGRLFVRSPSSQQLALLARASERQRGSATVHGPGDYWRVMRQASELAAMESGHGKADYLRVAPRTEEERLAARKAARLSLDTSAHGGDDFQRLLRQLETIDHKHKMAAVCHTKSSGSLEAGAPGEQQHEQQPAAVAQLGWPQQGPSPPSAAPLAPAVERAAAVAATSAAPAAQRPAAEERGRGRGAAKALLERMSAEPGSGGLAAVPEAGVPVAVPSTAGSEGVLPSSSSAPGSADHRGTKRVSFSFGGEAPMMVDSGPPAAAQPLAPAGQLQGQTLAAFSAAAAAEAGGSSSGSSSAKLGPITNPRDLEQLMRRMHFRSNKGLGPEEMSAGLAQLGYDLEPSEVAILMQQLDIDADGQVAAPEFVASQMDWGALQENNRDLWLECARRAFAGLDANSDGRLSVETLIGTLRDKLPAMEVDYAVEDALVEAGYADADEVDFDGFLRMLRVGSYDSLDALDQYDARYGGSLHGRLSADLEGSRHGLALESVPEETPGATPAATPRGP